MRRFTLLTLISLFLLIAIAAYFQIRAATRPGRFQGPAPGTFYPPSSSVPTSP